jgi:two-component system chemotaxis sensor kinase CheA
VDSTIIVVLQTDRRQFGLVVDTVGESREIIVKPLGAPVSQVSSYAGATILGDGHVALILDIHGIARTAGVVTETGHSILREAPGDRLLPDHAGPAAVRLPLLVFEARDDWRVALPLRSIARLEDVDVTAIEHVGDRRVMQYRGGIMPVVRIAHLLDPASPPAPSPGGPTIPVLVCRHQGRNVGLAVERIVDIEEHDVAQLEHGERGGLIASLVIGGRVTDVLDLDALLERADPALLLAPSGAAA